MKGTSMTTATTTNTRESKETVSLIASDKVEGTAVYGTDQKKFGKLERVMIDKLSEGCVCRSQLRRLRGNGRGLLSNALVHPEVRYQPRRLSRQSHQGPARKGAEIQQQHGLELEPRERPSSARLLQGTALLGHRVINPTLNGARSARAI